jgi:hypothetical protein
MKDEISEGAITKKVQSTLEVRAGHQFQWNPTHRIPCLLISYFRMNVHLTPRRSSPYFCIGARASSCNSGKAKDGVVECTSTLPNLKTPSGPLAK